MVAVPRHRTVFLACNEVVLVDECDFYNEAAVERYGEFAHLNQI